MILTKSYQNLQIRYTPNDKRFGSEKHETGKQSAPQVRVKRDIFLRPKGHGLYRSFWAQAPGPPFSLRIPT